jgi:hypothetical protein
MAFHSIGREPFCGACVSLPIWAALGRAMPDSEVGPRLSVWLE